MAPPAKRRKRATIVEDSDDDEDDKQQNRNTLKRFLFSSPDAKPSPNKSPNKSFESSFDIVPESPSPIRKRTTRAAAAKTKPTASAPPPSSLFPKRPTTKSPSTSPDKRARGQKKVKVEEKGRTADLLTLFSKQAQRSHASALNGNGKDSSALVLEDIASDPISEDDELALEKTAVGSSIVGRMASKRFRDSSQASMPPPASTLSSTTGQRFMKQPKATAPGLERTESDDTRPWSERFAPVNLEELAVHKKKVADVRRWLEDVLGGRLRQRLLILKGASGSGKTTTVQLLAKDLRCEVLEWRNPNTTYGMGQGFQSAASQFDEFLGRGGKFGQLEMESDTTPPPALPGPAPSTSERRIILIEEFPNTFVRSSTGLLSFRNAILQFLAANIPPLSNFGQARSSEPITPIVMIVSETLLTTASASADSFTAHRLLGPEILRHPGTGIIEFNAVAPTLLAKALELIVQKEARKSGRRRTPGPLVLKQLADIGDIRSSISSLEFLCVKGDDETDWGSKVAFTKPKRGAKEIPAMTKGEADSLQLVSQREATLGIFHAVGKVVYNKRAEQPFSAGSTEMAAETLPNYMAHLSRPKKSEVAVDSLMDETGTDTSTFVSALHENYALSCEQNNPLDANTSLDYLNNCLDYLSDSDILCPSWDAFFSSKGSSGGWAGKDSGSHILRQDEMAFQVAVRGLLFSLPSPVKRQAHPGGRGGDSFKMYYPAYLKLWRAKEELEGFVDMWATKSLKGEEGGPGPPHESLTSGSAMFRKSQPSGVESWGGRGSSSMNGLARSTQAGSAASEDSSAPTPLLSLGNGARQELLMERLPYMALIARRKRCAFGSIRARDLDRIVSFQGIGQFGVMADSDDEAEDDDGLVMQGESWATDKPTEEGTPKKKKGRRVGLGAILSKKRIGEPEGEGAETEGLPFQSLVLSDDDIEDD